jgi:hypothetical protein
MWNRIAQQNGSIEQPGFLKNCSMYISDIVDGLVGKYVASIF